MGLLVWIPMVYGDCKDQGLLGVETSVINTITYVDGKLGKAAQIGNGNQVTNGIQINTNLVEELGTQYSCSVWIKPLGNHVHYEGAIISSGNWNNKCWAFGVNQNNTAVDVFCGGYNRNVTCSVPVNEWTHLVSVNNGTHTHLYKNGELISTATTSSWPLSSDSTITTVGRESYAGGYFSFNGCVQDLRIYNHALSPLEIKHLAQGLVLHYPLSMPGQENLLVPQISDNKWVNWRANATWDSTNTREKIVGDDGKTWAHIIQNTTDGYGGYACDPSYNQIVIDSSKRYTWSCIAKAGAKENAEIVLWCHWRSTEGGNNLSQNIKKFQLTSNPQRISWTLPQYTNATYTVNRINLMMGVQGTGNNEIYFTDVKFEEGEVDTPWVPNPADPIYSAIGLDEDIIYDTSGFQNNGELFVLGKNLIDKNSVNVGGYINSSGGITGTSGWNYTNYIKVKPNTSYIASSISVGGSGTYFALYDASKTLTRTVLIIANQNPTFTTATNEKYIRFSIRSLSNELDTAKLEVGTTATAYGSEGSIKWETNSPRYILACNPHSANSTQNNKQGTTYIRGDCELITPNQLTIAFWCYARPQGYGGNNYQGLFCTTDIDFGDGLGSDYTSSAMNHRDDKVDVNGLNVNSKRLSIPIISNVWHHYAFTYDGQNAKSYRDGVLQDTQTLSSVTQLMSFKHILLGFSKAGGVWRRNNNTYSDLRVYTTALSADDVLELYHTPMSLANNGTLLAQGELQEV